jgi:hypothetical protein
MAGVFHVSIKRIMCGLVVAAVAMVGVAVGAPMVASGEQGRSQAPVSAPTAVDIPCPPESHNSKGDRCVNGTQLRTRMYNKCPVRFVLGPSRVVAGCRF